MDDFTGLFSAQKLSEKKWSNGQYIYYIFCVHFLPQYTNVGHVYTSIGSLRLFRDVETYTFTCKISPSPYILSIRYRGGA